MLTPRFFKWLIIEILVIGSIGAYLFIDSHDVYRWWVGDTHFVHADPTCDLHVKRCEVLLKDGTPLTLDIEPKSIPLMQPLRFRVTSTIDLPAIELKIFATNMNMGFHAFSLQKKAEGVYEGEGVLPTCVVGNMIWQSNVILNQPHQSQGAIFTFQTDK
ncbi:hypothetical protein [Sulfurospirillum deleyianum]|uniref:Periplasmic protein n=1 Tax=Sulfurospirillum deleyianum (strain ATCC 51133 / DSM 6946 / 5175) TaxID=525898 RepID=D1AZD9_SULD5|nr:hypothetical protein [Sulfurospirillum deleyianum]ACZ11406.1 hypothetical protein Sdel_0369 [Sulfurospirillum deleyianum DSM 6946]